MGGWGGVVAHKILVTSPEANFGLFGALGFVLWTGPLPRACQYHSLIMLKIPKLLHLVIIRGKTEWSVANILIGTPRDITFRSMINQAEEKYVYHFVCLFMPW